MSVALRHALGCHDDSNFFLRPTDARVGYWYELVVLGVWVDVHIHLKAVVMVVFATYASLERFHAGPDSWMSQTS